MKIRLAGERDLPRIFRMGYDVWNEGETEETHIQMCLNSAKYKKGVWHVLENISGNPVCSLICYKNAFGLPDNCAGIGSVATLPLERRKGYASQLVQSVVNQLIFEKIDSIFLYSEIDPVFYARMGFQALENHLQKHPPSLCMRLDAAKNGKETSAAPSYF